MEFSDFKIGSKFYTATGRWVTVDSMRHDMEDESGRTYDSITAIKIQDAVGFHALGLETKFYSYEFHGCQEAPWDRQ